MGDQFCFSAGKQLDVPLMIVKMFNRNMQGNNQLSSLLFSVLLVVAVLRPVHVAAFQSQPSPPSQDQNSAAESQRHINLICPGGFPTDLTVTNCEYTGKQRLQQWFTTSFSDQAMLGAVVYGAGAQIIKSPNEWGRNWRAYGDRIGVRYTQGAARGTAELAVGSLLRDDPRHLSYKEDPLVHYGDRISCKGGKLEGRSYPVPQHIVWRRIGHALVDSVTVRRSNTCGTGARLPALDRLVGVAAGAAAGYPWYPSAENTVSKTAQRAGMAYGSTLVGSFYAEFNPEISLLLKKIVTRKPKK